MLLTIIKKILTFTFKIAAFALGIASLLSAIIQLKDSALPSAKWALVIPEFFASLDLSLQLYKTNRLLLPYTFENVSRHCVNTPFILKAFLTLMLTGIIFLVFGIPGAEIKTQDYEQAFIDVGIPVGLLLTWMLVARAASALILTKNIVSLPETTQKVFHRFKELTPSTQTTKVQKIKSNLRVLAGFAFAGMFAFLDRKKFNYDFSRSHFFHYLPANMRPALKVTGSATLILTILRLTIEGLFTLSDSHMHLPMVAAIIAAVIEGITNIPSNRFSWVNYVNDLNSLFTIIFNLAAVPLTGVSYHQTITGAKYLDDLIHQKKKVDEVYSQIENVDVQSHLKSASHSMDEEIKTLSKNFFKAFWQAILRGLHEVLYEKKNATVFFDSQALIRDSQSIPITFLNQAAP